MRYGNIPAALNPIRLWQRQLLSSLLDSIFAHDPNYHSYY